MLKRLFDIIISLVALLLFLPFGFVIVTILRFTGEREIFYSQERIGMHGNHFKVYKFTTMLKNSRNLGSGDITVPNDPRVLPFGRFLRLTKLNEVPQFFNVLLGSMSIVGPRPLTPKNFMYYTPENQEIIACMKPGLTGIGSIVFRHEERIIGSSNKTFEQCYKEDISPYKAQLERWYYSHRGLLTDVLIVLLTFWIVFLPDSVVYRHVWKDFPAAPKSLQF